MRSFLAEATIPVDTRDADRVAEVSDDALSLLTALSASGQIWGRGMATVTRGAVRLTCAVPGADALAAEHGTRWTADDVSRFEARIGGPVPWQLDVPDGFETPTRACWTGEAALVLLTHVADHTSVVTAGSEGSPIPLYLLPLPDEVRVELTSWQARYAHADAAWLDSAELERTAWEAIARHDSDLNAEGRRLAAAVEAATGIPVYLYLARYHAFEEGEETRPCPACGGPWRQEATGGYGIASYAFRCDACRLVSVEGVSLDGDHLARIGSPSAS